MPYSYVLFVDDDFWCHLNTCDDLREYGLIVVEAYSACEATKVMGEAKRLTALVTDIDLGKGPDGFEVARRARCVYPGLPVVYVSGAARARHASEGVEGSEFVSKPFTARQIVEALDHASYIEAA